MPTVLITDNLFFFQEHEQQLKAAGYEVERLNKPDASEEELIEAVKGKIGYLFGVIEDVTEKVIDAAKDLKVISLTGIDFKGMIPAWEYATQKGIAITNTPDGPTNEVSEWAITAALIMNRHFLELGKVNKDTKFMVTAGIENQNIGIVGLGRVGSRIVELVKVFRPAEVNYYSRHRHEDKDRQLAVNYLELPELLSKSDIVFLCLDSSAKNYFDKDQFSQMKQDALLVNITHPGVIVENALYDVLQNKLIRAISDDRMSDKRFDSLELDRWYSMNTSSTITHAGAKLMSDTATNSLLNVLATGQDKFLTNPDYIKYRQ